MTLKRVTPEQSQVLRDRANRVLLRAYARAVRSFLEDIREATLAGLSTSPEAAGLAASVNPLPEPIHGPLAPEVPPLGVVAGRWAAAVDENIVETVQDTFSRTYSAYSTTMTSPALVGMETFTVAARDRLVLGTHFGVTVYEDSYDAVRIALARSVEDGWTRDELAQRIAASLSWETDGAYWRSMKAGTDAQIDGILDAIGPPGHPGREYARLNDPRVQLLRDDRNLAIRHLDSERSLWQTRATLIARTESTGMANLGAISALSAEGATHKQWLGGTRPTHAEADGQIVRMEEDFEVGGALLAFPGDPAGPVEEVANCTCTMIDADAR